MFNHCCVEYCDSKRKDINLYRFPKSEIMSQKWLECINSDSLRTLNTQDLRKQYVCRKHFVKTFFTSSGQRSRLRSDAYPTIFNHGTTMIIPDEANNVNDEHNYMKKRMHMDHTYCKPHVTEKRRRIGGEMCTMPSASYI
ncbi:THAP domain-containing protein 2-like, partial [Manduca sexta]